MTDNHFSYVVESVSGFLKKEDFFELEEFCEDHDSRKL